jgi:hypothetical protein
LSPSRSRSWLSRTATIARQTTWTASCAPCSPSRAHAARTWGRSAEQAMAARVVEACQQLGSARRSLTGR